MKFTRNSQSLQYEWNNTLFKSSLAINTPSQQGKNKDPYIFAYSNFMKTYSVKYRLYTSLVAPKGSHCNVRTPNGDPEKPKF